MIMLMSVVSIFQNASKGTDYPQKEQLSVGEVMHILCTGGF
jgi:hypothetical protein